MERLFFLIGALSGFFGVALGAFAAHALKKELDPDLLAVFETGVRYQMYHALALFAVAWACTKWPGQFTTASGLRPHSEIRTSGIPHYLRIPRSALRANSELRTPHSEF